MARHLHEQSGGNPSDHGPVPELANRPASPRSNRDFPDAPEADERPGPGGDLTDDQLRDFASRLGLDDDTELAERHGDERHGAGAGRPHGSEPSDGRPRVVEDRRGVAQQALRRVRRPAGRVLIVTSRGLGAAGRWLRSAGERIAEP